MEMSKFVGLDVHKASISIGVADPDRGEVRYVGTIANTFSGLRTALQRLDKVPARLAVVYEAGPTGFGLCRKLREAGYHCMIAAPSLIPVQAGNKIKLIA